MPQVTSQDAHQQRVSILGYAAEGAYAQCEAAMALAGSSEPLRLLLVRNGERYDYRIRCPRTLSALFGNATPISIDEHGPLVQVSAQRGLSGAVVTGFPGMSDATLARVYHVCSELREAVAGSGDSHAAALARDFGRAASRPYGSA